MSYPANFDSIIRGPEISLTSKLLPIRDATSSVSDPEASGCMRALTAVAAAILLVLGLDG